MLWEQDIKTGEKNLSAYVSLRKQLNPPEKVSNQIWD